MGGALGLRNITTPWGTSILTTLGTKNMYILLCYMIIYFEYCDDSSLLDKGRHLTTTFTDSDLLLLCYKRLKESTGFTSILPLLIT